ncbi:lipopolysaccharide biosynthesis protein [Intrasporangium flavum]|uniref:lipopolysaccharide biosynthesis protein n=1 Tax=Intrasporangium flavum TaxID=1428657 RepID=UPI00096F564D|nr:lipopolysaccharide biosynthesis protein [Intrasporangium flavum]
MRRRPGLVGFFSVSAPAVLNAVLTAVLGVLTARYLGPAGQGALTTIVTVGAILSLVLTLGTGVSVRLRARPVPRDEDVSTFFGASIVMTLAAALLAPAICLFFGLQDIGATELLLTALVAALLLVARQSSDLLQAYGRAGRSILFLAIGVLFQCLLFTFAVATGHATLRAALICAAAGAAVQTVLGAWDIFDQPTPRPALSWPAVRGLVRLGVPAVGYNVSLLVVQRLDRLVIVGVLGPAAGGVYAVAATMAEASRITSSAVGQLLFVQTAAAGAVTSTSRRTYRLALAVQGALAVVGWVLAPYAIPLLFGDAYADAVPLARLLLVAELFMGLALMDARFLMGLHRVPVVAYVTVALVVFAVPAYLVLVHTAALPGAVRASFMLYVVYAGVLLAARRRAERKVNNSVIPA